MSIDLTNKVIVITGASRGLGAVLAEVLSKSGARVTITARNAAELATVAKQTGAESIVADVTKEADMIRVAQTVMKKHGTLDIWINNAGVWMARSPVETADMNKAHELIEVNLFGTVYGTRAALGIMNKTRQGMIVNIVSTAALLPRPDSAMYSASKFAARGFTDSLRAEVAPRGITVIGIYPGGIKTHLFDEAKPADYDSFMDPYDVALRIVENLTKREPELEQVLRRPGQK